MTKTGVVLLNMGGPEKLEDVRPFLFNLFSDRDIIKLGPSFLQKPIAWYIAKKRAPKSRELYKHIGGGSPLTEITLSQASSLQDFLQKESDDEYVTAVAMRYWQPGAGEALKKLEKAGVERLIVLPLYPHYSIATSGSSLKDFDKALALSSLADKIPSPTIIQSWQSDSRFAHCLANNISNGLARFDGEAVQLLYSAHSLPVSFIKEGDPYVDHLNETIQEVEKLTGVQGKLCYQSRSGPVEWLSPSTSDTLVELSQEGCKNVLVVPISFVSDHVETLYEINIMFRQEAEAVGMRLEMTEGLNTHPDFIECLAELVLSANS